MKKIALSTPLLCDPTELIEYFPSYSYGGPIAATKYMPETTSQRITDPSDQHRMIISLDGYQEGAGFTKLLTDLSAAELSSEILVLPEAIQQSFRNSLSGTELQLPQLSVQQLDYFAQEKQRKIDERARFEEVKAIGQPVSKGKFTANEARDISQHELGYTDSTSQRPILASSGAGPCVIMAVYNPDTKEAALTHIDGLTDLDSTYEIFYQFGQNATSPLEVHFAGGDRSSIEKCIEIVNLVYEKENVCIKSADLIGEGIQGKKLAIDSRTGEIFTEFQRDQVDLGEHHEIKSEIFGMSMGMGPSRLKLAFDDRKTSRDAGIATEITSPVIANPPQSKAQAEEIALGPLSELVRGSRSVPSPQQDFKGIG